jgi:hypothetical protein
METIRKMEAAAKIQKKKATTKQTDGTTQASAPEKHESYLPPYLLVNKNALLAAGAAIRSASGMYKDAHNERA